MIRRSLPQPHVPSYYKMYHFQCQASNRTGIEPNLKVSGIVRARWGLIEQPRLNDVDKDVMAKGKVEFTISDHFGVRRSAAWIKIEELWEFGHPIHLLATPRMSNSISDVDFANAWGPANVDIRLAVLPFTHPAMLEPDKVDEVSYPKGIQPISCRIQPDIAVKIDRQDFERYSSKSMEPVDL